MLESIPSHEEQKMVSRCSFQLKLEGTAKNSGTDKMLQVEGFLDLVWTLK